MGICRHLVSAASGYLNNPQDSNPHQARALNWQTRLPSTMLKRWFVLSPLRQQYHCLSYKPRKGTCLHQESARCGCQASPLVTSLLLITVQNS